MGCNGNKIFTSQDGFQYLEHAINCRPLYMCKLCGSETKHQSYLKKHLMSCRGSGNVNSPLKFENNEHSSSDSAAEAFLLKKENSAGKVKKKILIGKTAKVDFGKRIKANTGIRKNMALRKRNPYKCKESSDIKSE